MLKKLILGLCLAGGVVAAVIAAENARGGVDAVPVPPMVSGSISPADVQLAQKALDKLSNGIHIDAIEPAALPGFYQVIASGRLVYISRDGRYLLDGNLIDLASKTNLSDVAWANYRKAALARVPASQRIVFSPPHPKYTISVFTDVNCGYCRALHEHVAAFNKAGIAVEYLAWPREGVTTTSGSFTPTYTEMASVWCAPDREAAFSAATDGKAPKPASCVNPVKDQFNLGLQLGVTGTPTIFGPDGRTLGGYVTPDQLLQALKDGS
jgi:thiol:disulfide interchange protein DsbC